MTSKNNDRVPDTRGQISTTLFVIIATVVMVYASIWVAFEYFFPLDESVLADGVSVVRGAFIDVLGPTRGAATFLALVLGLALLFSVIAFTDLIGPEMMDNPGGDAVDLEE